MPRQHDLARKRLRHVAAGVVLAAAGVIANTTAPLSTVHVSDIRLVAGDEDIVIDFVRHGLTVNGNSTVASQVLPGSPLSAVGEEQASAVGTQLYDELGGPNGVAGIFAGQNVRMPETAAPLAALEEMNTQSLSGLNEIGGGIYAGDPLSGPGGILYELTEAAWTFGLLSVPLPGSNYFNGVDFEQSVGAAVQTMYGDAVADPVVSANGSVTDVAVSGEAAISTWVLLNVDNPDLAIFIPRLLDSLTSGDATPFLSNAGVVEVKGNPTDGWTLVSFDGQAIPQDPGLLTQLVVDVRDVITPPQIAAYNVFEAALTGDPTTIEDALATGVQSIDAALTQFPESVADNVEYAVQNLAADVAAGQSFNAAFDSLILGMT